MDSERNDETDSCYHQKLKSVKIMIIIINKTPLENLKQFVN